MAIVQAVLDGVLTAGLYALVAIGLTLILGMLDVANFAHGQALMIGSYAAYLVTMTLHLPFAVAMVCAVVLAAAFGAVLEVVVFRRVSTDHLRAITASLGVILILENLTETVFTADPKTMDIPVPGALRFAGISLPWQRVVVFAVAALLIAGFYFYTRRGRAGLALRAVADSPSGAALMGIRINRTTRLVFIIGSAMAGVAGALLASLFPIDPRVGDVPLLKAFIVAIVGGLGSVPGVIVAALGLGITESLGARFVSASFRDGYGFIVLLIVLLVRPNGVFGLSREERL